MPPSVPADELVVAESAVELTLLTAQALAAALRRVLESRERASLVLAGGSTPRPVYQALAARDDLPWERIELFFGDERCVPPTDAASNFRLVEESLLSALEEPPAAVHRIPGELGAEAAAERYDQILDHHRRQHGGWDLALLGLGEDGHTASLFPGDLGDSPASAGGRLAAPARAPVEPTERVTLTFAALAAVETVCFLARGGAKAEALRAVLSGQPPVPAARVAGRRRWFVDLAALV